MIRLFCSCFITLVLIAANSFAQTKREYSGLFDTYYYRGPISFTGGLGTAAYNGALGTFTSPSYAFNLGASYKVWPRIALGAEFLYYQLKGSKTTDTITSSFSSSNMELDLYGRFYLIDDIVRVAPDRNKQPKLVKPYLTTGIGFLRYSPTLTYAYTGNQPEPAIKPVSASGFTIAIPFGAGLAIGVSPRVSILADITYRYTLSSNLDATGQQKDGYLLACAKVQFSPFVPVKKKKKSASSAPAPYEGTKGTETWKNRKKKPANNEDAYPPLPGEEQQQNQENPENPDQQKNEGDENQQNPEQNQNEGGENQDPNAPSPKQ